MTPSDPSSPSFSKDAVDPIVHSPARLHILAVLSAVESADFIFIRRQTHLTKGNLSSHMSKLEEAGYRVIVSIGETEENLIGSNCGQYILKHLRSDSKLRSGYLYQVEN